MLGKMLLTKKAHEKISRPRAKFNGRLNCQAGRENMAQCRLLARHVFYRRGGVKEVSACMVVSGRGGAVLEHSNFC
jgi:hypothetical protein